MVAIVGKRGSGKSYSLGTLIEPLAISDATLTVANTNRSRAALLFDTLGIFQWMDVPVTESGESTEIRNQYRARSGWDLPEASIDVAVWRPRGSGRLSDHHMELAVRCSDLDSSDWCYLLGLDPIQDRMGQLLSDAFQKVTSEGWRSEQGFKQPKLQYGLDDIVSCIQSDDELISAYQSETKRALTQQLKTFSRNPIFSDDGIGLKDLLKPGRLSVVVMNQMSAELRFVLITSIIRRLMRSRIVASEIEKELRIRGDLDPSYRAELIAELEESVPPTWVAAAEA